MDRNVVLACALSLAVLVGWSYLTGNSKHRRQPPENPPSQVEATDSTAVSPGEAASASAASAPVTSAAAAPTSAPPPRAPANRVSPPERQIRFELPLYEVELTSRGAAISSWKLVDFREKPDPASKKIDLVTSEAATSDEVGRPLFTTPFSELGAGDFADRVFEVVREDATSVSFEAREGDLSIRKTYSFDPKAYSLRLLVEVANHSTAPVTTRFAIDIPAHTSLADDFVEQSLAALQDGSRVTTPLKGLGRSGFMQSIFGRKPPPYHDYLGQIDWAGIDTTYFLAAIVPDKPSEANLRISALEPGVSGIAELWFDDVELPAGRSVARELRGYLGPKETDRLEAFGGETIHAINLGWSWVEPLTGFFSWFLKVLYSLVPNYGIAIIILTVLVRVVTAPLTIKQMRSMEKMRVLKPKLDEIREQFADDRQRQSQEQMALYKREGVNPLGGCLPMLLQMPVFIGLFYALRSTIQLRQAPFFGWIHDLSVPESLFVIPGLGVPFRVLPLIMGVTMVLQQRITPTQGDPAQAKMMMTVMPVMMTVIFYQFPSGLVLYWMVSNMLAISHQLWIGRGLRANKAT